MGSLFRSEKMSLYQLYLQNESAYKCIAELGELGLVEFRDLNGDTSSFQRKYIAEIRRCEEMERRVHFVEKEMKKTNIKIVESDEFVHVPLPKQMIDLEAALEKIEDELKEVNENTATLKKNLMELTELDFALKFIDKMLDKQDILKETVENVASTVTMEEIIGQPLSFQIQQLGFVTGVIPRERIAGFERVLWRTGRGNLYMRQMDIPTALQDPVTGHEISKVVFVIFFQGEQLKSRVKKICEGFRATLYSCPEIEKERRNISIGVMSRIEDIKVVLERSTEHRQRILEAAAKNIHKWFVSVRKITAIYHTLNLFNVDITQKCLIGECWIPDSCLEDVEAALLRGHQSSESEVAPILNKLTTNKEPPTYHRTNKFTKAFQTLVDSYGVAKYREVNPAPFGIITFPFLFAVMFGDAGHSLIMILFGLFMVLKEKSLSKISGEIWKIFFGGRYLILMMGLFSFYTGMMYNDVFSKALNIFGSSWKVSLTIDDIKEHESHMLVPDPNNSNYAQIPYPFGIDPVWALAENKIMFLNSYKMKTSIIFGVLHMTVGVVLNLWNFTYFKRKYAIIVEFIPQMIFLLFLFGYLCVLMIIKWIKYSAGNEEFQLSSGCAPSILITFIGMMMFQGEPEVPDNCKTQFMFPGQGMIQTILVLTALLSIPVLLLGTPLILLFKHRRHEKSLKHEANGSIESDGESHQPIVKSSDHGSEDGEEEFQFGEIMIHQAIHTIEYVLESISHTASYLRLWALSLAHAQLSEVLWNMVLRIGFQTNGYLGSVFIFGTFTFWAGATVGILIVMEGLSAFLHTLRLHWVEFQGKFYDGTGYTFTPFNFKHVLKRGEE